MKLIVLMTALMYGLSSYAACPQLQGRYNKCFSEIRKIKGEYIIDQHQENDYEVYNVEYYDDETGDSRKDVLKTNKKKEMRKEKLPKMGITVKISSHSYCEGNAVVSDADVHFLGAKVGSFVSKIFTEGRLLKSNIDGSYLGKDVHKRIVCELE